MPRSACVIQITPVRLTRTSANDASVVRKIYLSIDPIGYRTIPPHEPQGSRTKVRTASIAKSPTNPPGNGGSPWLGQPALEAPISHYHPFDPSTKWLAHGGVHVWLIFPRCDRPATASLAPCLPAGHIVQMSPQGSPRQWPAGTTETPRGLPQAGFLEPANVLIFGGFSYARRRQGRLRPFFRRPARNSGGVLRR